MSDQQLILKNGRLRLVIEHTQLLSALRQVSYFVQKNQNKQTSQKPSEKASERPNEDKVVIEYLISSGKLFVIGLLQGHFSLKFEILSSARTYKNIVALIYQVVRSSLSINGGPKLNGQPTLSVKTISEIASSYNGELTLSSDIHSATVYPGDFVVQDDEPFPALLTGKLSRSTARRQNARAILHSFSPSSKEVVFEVFDRSEARSKRVNGMITEVLHEEISMPESAGQSIIDQLHETSLSKEGAPGNPRIQEIAQSFTNINAQTTETGVTIRAEANISQAIEPYVEIFAHWGPIQFPNNDPTNDWCDEQVATFEVTRISPERIAIQKVLTPHQANHFALKFFVCIAGSKQKYWSPEPAIDFRVNVGFDDQEAAFDYQEMSKRIELKSLILGSLVTFESFFKTISSIVRERKTRALGRMLFDLTKDEQELRALLSSYYEKAVYRLGKAKSQPLKNRLQDLTTVLQNLGVGEVVFVAPEGPHAIAGGLAHVIMGLTQSLSECGISTTLITPLYEESQGNKHKSAEDIIAHGVTLGKRTVPIKRIGVIEVQVGPTNNSGTAIINQSAQRFPCEVYLAESDNIRIFFLRNRRLANRLYPNLPPDELLRQVIFLSRGALELLRSKRFGISPHILITNDWPTALVPVYLKTDPKYLKSENLRGLVTAHILHNCGRAYQGKFFVNQYGEDLYPMLGIKGEHYFGLSDPENMHCINLSAGAVFHVERALVAVSKPYAEELFTREGGEGLHELFRKKARAVFGISNGVDLQSLRYLFWELGEHARSILDLTQLSPERFTERRLVERLPLYKEAMKLIVQRKNGLKEDPNAVLVSLIGRLAEQKGIGLLSQKVEDRGITVLEAILQKSKHVQVIIGGPPSENDPSFERLVKVLKLLIRKYPGRIQGILDFIPHAEVLEITGASDLFLMPSRYEPGGITQLEALAAGALVIARNVGGISATLVNYGDSAKDGNAFLFDEFSGPALLQAISRALLAFVNAKTRKTLMLRAATAEHDWKHRTPKYLSMFQYVSGVFSADNFYPHLRSRYHVLSSIRPEDEMPYV